jgi:AraC-like DNA-binding protein
MIGGGLSAVSAAQRVGSESPSQFSREFKRLFGRAPRYEVLHLKALLATAPAVGVGSTGCYKLAGALTSKKTGSWPVFCCCVFRLLRRPSQRREQSMPPGHSADGATAVGNVAATHARAGIAPGCRGAC